MNEIMILLEVLLSKQNSGELPSVAFKANNDLYEEACHIAGMADFTSATTADNEKLAKWMSEIAGYLTNPETSEAVSLESASINNDVLDRIADQMADKINGSSLVLKGISNSVSGISKAVDTRINREIALDPFLAKHANAEEVSQDIDTFPFASLASLGSKTALIEYVEQESGQKINYDVNATVYRAIEMCVIKMFPAARLEASMLSQEIKNDLIAAVNESSEALLNDNVVDFCEMLTTGYLLKNRVAKLKLLREAVNVMPLVTEFVGEIASYKNLCSRFETAISNNEILDQETATKLGETINAISDYCDLAGYFVYHHRGTTFKDAVVMPNGTLNPDNIKAYQADGIKLVDICRHIRSRHEVIPLPNRGITLASLVDNKDRIAKVTEETASQIEIRVKSDIATITREAIAAELYEYLITEAKEDPTDDLFKYASHKAGYATTKNMPCEDIAYDMIISRYHNKSFVSVLHKRLGTEYSKVVSAKKEIDSTDITLVNVGVYAELVTEFIRDNFIRKEEV